jgi:hypothetical protein
MRALLKGNRRLGNFMISAFLPDFTEFLPSTGPPLPDLQGFHSQMAKVEYNGLGVFTKLATSYMEIIADA